MYIIVQILAAQYHAYRRQGSSATESLLWVKVTNSFPLAMSGMALLFVVIATTMNKENELRQCLAHTIAYFFYFLLIGAFYCLHIFVRKQQRIITEPIGEDAFQLGRLLGWTYLVVCMILSIGLVIVCSPL
ncbi:hypothetical protein [Hymenobacter cheonanensis]|uniref:hypothetical protein n=1 Tax=Hymenobacter sp. CA2-7 TaxID=3063993 RepID=UPI002713D609|nr:hypothetical protein [Hymenobacter sp. CA2-7]MDO7887256.1 hypothetical protein [Hymenobacter sp. CA2-7]